MKSSEIGMSARHVRVRAASEGNRGSVAKREKGEARVERVNEGTKCRIRARRERAAAWQTSRANRVKHEAREPGSVGPISRYDDHSSQMGMRNGMSSAQARREVKGTPWPFRAVLRRRSSVSALRGGR